MTTSAPDWARRPGHDEHAPFYAKYIALVPDGHVLDTMERAGRELVHLLRGVPTTREEHRYAPGKWSVRELVGHVVDAEWVFAHRALWFARGAPDPLPGFEENDWARQSPAGARPLDALAEDFARVRAATVALFRGMTAADVERRGVANGVELTARAVAWIIVGHAAHHRRVLEERYLG